MENYPQISQGLRKDAVEARLHFEIWWAYGDPNNPALYSQVMDRYSTFFITSKNAHFVATILPLYRIFETRSDTVNLPQLLKKLREVKVLQSIQLIEFENEFLTAKPVWVKIATLRNEVFGHRSNKFTVEASFKKAGISANDIFDFIDKTLNLLNKVDLQLNSNSYQAFQTNSGEDIRQILNVFRQNYQCS